MKTFEFFGTILKFIVVIMIIIATIVIKPFQYLHQTVTELAGLHAYQKWKSWFGKVY